MWYIKKQAIGNDRLALVPSSILIFSVFNWISELVRYNPKLFNKYMKSKQNWLIHEFINNSLDQFVDEIGCEITGEDIMLPVIENNKSITLSNDVFLTGNLSAPMSLLCVLYYIKLTFWSILTK